MSDDPDFSALFKPQLNSIQQKLVDKRRMIEDLESKFFDLDAVINLKINSDFKKAFEDYCKKQNSTMSREIKNLMFQAIKTSR